MPSKAFRTAPVYGNMMVALAGRVAERVTGKSFENLLREEIFEPLGMTSSGFTSDGTGDIATSYALKNGAQVALNPELLQ